MDKLSKEMIFNDVMGIIKDMLSDFDTELSEDIKPESRLAADIGFESVDVIELIMAIEKHYQSRRFPFQKLVMQEGRYVDFTINQLVDFLYQYL